MNIKFEIIICIGKYKDNPFLKYKKGTKRKCKSKLIIAKSNTPDKNKSNNPEINCKGNIQL